ncbi:hypothetical protein ACFWAY_31365 [Rhodococcus sp. NPDC059968]|uniref:hypothetical protein n=1 Tax=Rhodococcus sp. NPDC059968 TaxID=3347017 RepID=UPI00366C89AE
MKWVRDFAPEGADFQVELMCTDTHNDDLSVTRGIDIIRTGTTANSTYVPEVVAAVDKCKQEAWAAKRP